MKSRNMKMNRREALKTSGLILGYTVTAGTVAAVMNGCAADPALDWAPKNLTVDQALFLDELSEMIIPKTETPGAKDALVNRFIDEILDTYSAEDKAEHLAELDAMMLSVNEEYGKKFIKCSPEDQKAVLDAWVADKKSNMFPQIKEWTVVGYCTSEAGATEHLYWDPVPGAPFQGCIDFDEVGKTWAL